MMTAILHALEHGQALPGRHLVVTAHPDDETISSSALLSLAADVRLVQITDGVPPDASDRAAMVVTRARERGAALSAGRWPWTVTDLAIRGREAVQHLGQIVEAIRAALVDVDVVWTHPYEGGHLDHDTAAVAVQRACTGLQTVRMEFASYHSLGAKRDVFGAFWPDARHEARSVLLGADTLSRKRAAMAAYPSQAHILRKFTDATREAYRTAPMYNFAQKVPPPACRWDLKGYRPTTAVWRALVADAAVAA